MRRRGRNGPGRPGSTPPARRQRLADVAEAEGWALAAAADGAGVALARSLLVRDAVADGRLARALPATADRPSTKIHVVRWPAALAGDRAVTSFVDWLVTETA